MDVSRPFYALAGPPGQEGFYRFTPARIAGADEVLKSLADRQSIRLSTAFKSDTAFGGSEHYVSLAIKREYIMAACRIDRLCLRTTFSILPLPPAAGGDALVPEFRQRTRPDCEAFLDKTLWWKTPVSMRLILAFKYRVGSRSIKEAVLFATGDDPRVGTWKLPLPNHFGDGRLCLGSALDDGITGTTFQACVEKALNIFYESTWNSDQMPDMGKARKLFRFSPHDDSTLHTGIGAAATVNDENGEPYRMPGWTEHCIRASHPAYTEVLQCL